MVADLTTSGPRTAVRFVIVRVPGDGQFEVPLRMAVFAPVTGRLTWVSGVVMGFVPLAPDQVAVQDKLGHIGVRLGTGAHGGVLYALDPADGVHVHFFGPSSQSVTPTELPGWWTDTPDAHAEDLDGDGIFELVVPVNDYEPSYVEGTRTVFRYKWNGKDYVVTGCTVLARGKVATKDYPATDRRCAPSTLAG